MQRLYQFLYTHMQPTHRITIHLTIWVALLISGCTPEPTPEELNQVARTYMEVLIQKEMYGRDSARTALAIDSVLELDGYDDYQELAEAISDISVYPDAFRSMLDTVHQRLDRTVRGTDSTLLPKLPSKNSDLPQKKRIEDSLNPL